MSRFREEKLMKFQAEFEITILVLLFMHLFMVHGAIYRFFNKEMYHLNQMI